MNGGNAHHIWIEQCEAAQTIRIRYGLKTAFDYIVGEKLLNFAAAAAMRAEFARDLPKFVAEVRRMFTAEEIAAHLERIEHQDTIDDAADADEEDPLRESPVEVAERGRRFMVIKELLTATALGTS
jgi:hypothetical protein